jgi:hypothetical protein
VISRRGAAVLGPYKIQDLAVAAMLDFGDTFLTWRKMLHRCKAGDQTKAEMPVMRSPMTSLWMSLVPS